MLPAPRETDRDPENVPSADLKFPRNSDEYSGSTMPTAWYHHSGRMFDGDGAVLGAEGRSYHPAVHQNF